MCGHCVVTRALMLPQCLEHLAGEIPRPGATWQKAASRGRGRTCAVRGPAWCWEDAPRPRAAPAAPGTSCGSVSLCRELNLSCWGRPAARLQSLLYKVPVVALDGGG